jgi:predicted metal-dependent phosphoesterase TrpH
MHNYDLHCHSRISDGVLAPAEVVRRAAKNGVDTLALTDHDDVRGISEASATARECGIEFVPGVEISVSWHEVTLHIVGLHIDPEHPVLLAGLAGIRAGRRQRAEKMAESLAAAGVPDALAGAMSFAGNPDAIGRTHFARHLVSAGYASEPREVFRRFLTRGKPGYVAHQWASLPEAVSWIKAAGGQAVIAHPGRYDLSAAQMRKLAEAFRLLGGVGIEVVTGSHQPNQYFQYADFARAQGLLASRGADFHAPGEGADLGRLPALPKNCTPIWHDWPTNPLRSHL